jgi:hypothetical protein
MSASSASRRVRLTRRQAAALGLPGAMIGLLGGAFAGVLAAVGSQPLSITLAAAIALATPLAIAGAGYDLLLATGRMPLGTLSPGALYWVAAFPLARAIQAVSVDLVAGDPLTVPHGWADFIAYQAILSVGFAIGFWWLHENFALRWWFRQRDRNPAAAHLVRTLLHGSSRQLGDHDGPT